jgi:hypothetical protein
MVSASGGDTFYYYSGAAASADQYSQLKVTTLGGSKEWGPAVRIKTGATLEGYFLDTFPGSEGIYKYVAGASSLVQPVTYTCVVNDIVRIEVQGSTLRFKVNGVEVTGSPGTDGSITAAGGGPGVFLITSAVVVDDFDGGDLVTAEKQSFYVARRRSVRR